MPIVTQQDVAAMSPDEFKLFVAHIEAASNSSSSNSPTPTHKTAAKNARDMSPEEWAREKRRLGLR